MHRVVRAIAAAVLLMLAAVVPAADGPQRIVSLAPNLTEILFGLGIADRVAGVTSFCDYPEEALRKPRVGGMSNPSLEAIVSLRPDLVVLTMDGNPKEIEEKLRSLKIRTYVFQARKITDFPAALREIGGVVGAPAKAESMARGIEASITKNRDRAAGSGRKKKVLFIVWPEPLVVAGPGSIPDEGISLLGAENMAANARSLYPKYAIEEIIRRSPDVIFIGKGMSRDMVEVSKGLLTRLKNVPAVKNGRVRYVSDTLYRLGPRTMSGVDEIAPFIEQ